MKKTNELTVYGMLCRNVNILSTRTSLFISSGGKIASVQKFRLNFPSSCFIVDESCNKYM